MLKHGEEPKGTAKWSNNNLSVCHFNAKINFHLHVFIPSVSCELIYLTIPNQLQEQKTIWLKCEHRLAGTNSDVCMFENGTHILQNFWRANTLTLER